jgi:hypothetical protein
MDESEEPRCQFIKPGSNPPILLQLIEEAFYQMTFLVLEEVAVPRINSIRFRGNAEIGIPIGDVLSKVVRAIRFIGQYGSFIRFQINVIQNIFRNDRIVNIPG